MIKINKLQWGNCHGYARYTNVKRKSAEGKIVEYHPSFTCWKVPALHQMNRFQLCHEHTILFGGPRANVLCKHPLARSRQLRKKLALLQQRRTETETLPNKTLHIIETRIETINLYQHRFVSFLRDFFEDILTGSIWIPEYPASWPS